MAADPELLKAVVKHYGGETRDGYSKAVRCCFHDDTRRSAVMSTDGDRAGLYFCHTCGIGGDAYSLLMWKEGIDFRVAIDRAVDIAKRAGYDLSDKDKRRDGGLLTGARVQSRAGRNSSTRHRTSRL
jgi:DNA primase